jgi:hypothetical protein
LCLSILAALACLAGVAAPASATQLPATDRPLPASTFQGGDGDQDDAGGHVDWQSLAGVRHVSDYNPRDTAFDTGKENNPGGWRLTEINNGVGPPADNIRDMWAAVDQPGADTFLYLAFSRAGGGGTHFLAFELNRDARLWDNDDDDRTLPIPCRRTDDLDITYVTQGGVPAVDVRRWVTEDADPRTSCARTGHFEGAVGVDPNVTAQGQLNDTEIASRLGGAFSPRVPAQQFGEAALNLSDIVEDVFGDGCLAYSSIWMHSRASGEEGASKKDYVAPEPLRVRSCSASGVKFWDGNNNHVRDPGEPGLPNFKIWADYDNDGEPDADEPFSITDKDGQYGDLRHPRRPPAVTTSLVIDRRRARAVLRRAGTRIWRAPVGLGAPGMPTPRGRFYIREKIRNLGGSPIYGPWAFGTSAYSSLSDWPGGGVVGIHGTDQPWLIPGRPSHGCVRVRNRAIVRLARLMPIGTPVRIL